MLEPTWVLAATGRCLAAAGREGPPRRHPLLVVVGRGCKYPK